MMLRVISSVVAISLLAFGCGKGSDGDRRVVLKDLGDLSQFSDDEQERLQEEYRSLPRTLIVRASATGEERQGPEVEVRQYHRTVNLNNENASQVWDRGKNSGLAELAHNIRHSGRHWRRQMRGHGHSRHHKYGHRRYSHYNNRTYRPSHYYNSTYYPSSAYNYPTPTYNYSYLYQPYYRSARRSNLWWNSYRHHNSYYQPGGYRYYVYYPNSYYSTSNRYCITTCY